eukprot:6644774-Alexandrium_andersonii.AAC.1
MDRTLPGNEDNLGNHPMLTPDRFQQCGSALSPLTHAPKSHLGHPRVLRPKTPTRGDDPEERAQPTINDNQV